MNKALRLTLAVCMGLVMVLGTVPVLAEDSGVLPPPPTPPPSIGWHMFYGDVSVGGSPAYDGTVVAAHIDGLSWETTTTGGSYGYSPVFYIPSDNPGTPAKDGGINGDVVTFTVSGMNVTPTRIFSEDSATKLDLSLEGMVAQVSGVTCEVNCDTLGSVTIELFAAGGDTAITGTTSDGSGNYVLPVASTGTYDVVASKNGFRDAIKENLVVGAGVSTLNFKGSYGLVPETMILDYFLDCMNKYLEDWGDCSLDLDKFLEAMNAYLGEE